MFDFINKELLPQSMTNVPEPKSLADSLKEHLGKSIIVGTAGDLDANSMGYENFFRNAGVIPVDNQLWEQRRIEGVQNYWNVPPPSGVANMGHILRPGDIQIRTGREGWSVLDEALGRQIRNSSSITSNFEIPRGSYEENLERFGGDEALAVAATRAGERSTVAERPVEAVKRDRRDRSRRAQLLVLTEEQRAQAEEYRIFMENNPT